MEKKRFWSKSKIVVVRTTISLYLIFGAVVCFAAPTNVFFDWKMAAEMSEDEFINKFIKPKVVQTAQGKMFVNKLSKDIKTRLKFKLNCRFMHQIVKTEAIITQENHTEEEANKKTQFCHYCFDASIVILQKGMLVGNEEGEESLPIVFENDE